MNSFSVLVLSTAHVTKDVAEALDEIIAARAEEKQHRWGADDWRYWIVAEQWSGYGWWVWAEQEDALDLMPPCLRHALKFATDHGHRWVQFDCDEPPIPELPSWEW